MLKGNDFFKIKEDQPLTVMGLMSGTSVDGVDACLARLQWVDGHLRYDILATDSQDMPDDLRQRLLTCMAEKTIHLEEFCALNVAVGELFADAALALIQKNKIDPKSIDCIGSHGQTLYHWPPPEVGKLGGTLQIGEPSIIAEKTGIAVMADFRPRDMAAGGQGAPLVCFADKLLFQDETMGRCIQNIGGIANVTVLPAKIHDQPLMAFDTGPGNMLMDAAMMCFYQQGYDRDGTIAASGAVQEKLLAHLMGHPYLTQAPPKTTGRELFGQPYFEKLRTEFPDVQPADWLATLNRFTALSIIDAYERFVLPQADITELIVGGGGAYNRTLMEAIAAGFWQKGRKINLKTHADFGIHDQYKEALAFAILAWSALIARPNNLPECTGAAHPVILGKLIPA